MKSQKGLSAVELLVALLVASVFLISGYQLYTYIFQNGTQSSQMAEASNIAYVEMRKKAASISSGATCIDTSATPTVVTGYNGSTLRNATITTIVTCPYSTAPLNTISKVTSTATYNDAQGAQSVVHSIFKS